MTRSRSRVRETTPRVRLIASPKVHWDAVAEAMVDFGGMAWLDRVDPPGGPIASDAELLAEYAGRRCYDDQTEILTEHGWSSGVKLDSNVRVATLTRGGEVIWEIPLAYYKYDYDGDLLRCNQRNLDLAVTPEHRMWTQKMYEGGYFGKWHFATAETIAERGSWRMQRGGVRIPPTVKLPSSVVIPRRSYASGLGHRIIKSTNEVSVATSDYVEFLGYVISEGHISTPRDGSGWTIGITQKDGPVLDRILSVITRMGLAHHVAPDPRKPAVKTVRVGGGMDFVTRVSTDCGGRTASTKRVPRWLMESDRSLLMTFYEALWLGDGHNTPTGSRAYTTTSEGLADDVQEIILRLGGTASISEHRREEYPLFVIRELESHLAISRSSQRPW